MTDSAYYKQHADNLLRMMEAKKAEHRAVADTGSTNFRGSGDDWSDAIIRLRAEFYEMKSQLAMVNDDYREAVAFEKSQKAQALVVTEENKAVALLDAENERIRLQAHAAKEQREFEAQQEEKRQDHALQVALIRQKTAEHQIEATRLAAEMSAKAQEQSKQSFDALLKGVIGNGSSENG